jgi:hypothetical protein
MLLFASLICCLSKEENSSQLEIYKSPDFKSYWHAGKAEVNSYKLSQSRYGETHEGNAVLIFVTEDFSRKKHVKLDQPEEAKKLEKVNVLKLNFTKNFITGIYPYSMMLSVFTPIDREHDPSSVKTVMSVQEWCGQVYAQMNLRGNRYNIKTYSYFEDEADRSFSVKQVLLEDELWNLIRLDHENLPQGEIKILPGLFFTRLQHTDLKSETAQTEKIENKTTFTYTVTFSSNDRKLNIEFEKVFPHKITRWTETWKHNGKEVQTIGELDRTMYTDYWTKNHNSDQHLRDSLNLK